MSRRFKLITGFYPSENTAQKIAEKARGNCKDARVEQYDDCFTVVLAESASYDEIDRKFSECMNKKLYCGIIESEHI